MSWWRHYGGDVCEVCGLGPGMQSSFREYQYFQSSEQDRKHPDLQYKVITLKACQKYIQKRNLQIHLLNMIHSHFLKSSSKQIRRIPRRVYFRNLRMIQYQKSRQGNSLHYCDFPHLTYLLNHCPKKAFSKIQYPFLRKASL